MGLFDDLMEKRPQQSETAPIASKPVGLFDDVMEKRNTPQQKKRPFLESAMRTLQQLQRPQSAIATAFVEGENIGKKDYERRQAGGGQDPLLSLKAAANVPGALWRGLTAKTEDLKDFTDVARNVGLDPYRNITDAWQDVKEGKSNIQTAML